MTRSTAATWPRLPRPGGLTGRPLESSAASLTLIEKDLRTAPILAALAETEEGRRRPARPVRRRALRDLLEMPAPRAVVANLPYNVATPLLVRWLRDLWREPGAYRSLTLMFQREVVDRIVARPGDRAYGRLAVLTALSAAAAYRQFDVPAQAFTPPPKVTSAIVRIDARDSLPGPLALFETIEGVTAAAFGQRRKMLRQSLKSVFPDPVAVLEELDIAPTARAEELLPEAFLALAKRR